MYYAVQYYETSLQMSTVLYMRERTCGLLTPCDARGSALWLIGAPMWRPCVTMLICCQTSFPTRAQCSSRTGDSDPSRTARAMFSIQEAVPAFQQPSGLVIAAHRGICVYPVSSSRTRVWPSSPPCSVTVCLQFTEVSAYIR